MEINEKKYNINQNLKYRLIDVFLLFLMSSLPIFQMNKIQIPVLALLIAFIIGMLGLYINSEKMLLAVCLIFLLCCFFLPELAYYLPIVIYHLEKSSLLWKAICILPVLALMEYGNKWFVFLWMFSCILAWILAERTVKIEYLESEMIRLRDSSMELNMVLKEKNKSLIEKQDYEIYLATLKERNRIAREIHDNVGHMLSRSILQMGALGTIYKEEPLHGQLMSVNDTLNQAMNSIRESVHDLHDEAIDLKQAVLDATAEMQKKYDVKIDYDISSSVPRNIKYCFISTVKEAMSNVVKHSNATKINILLREHPSFYQLSIEDNGTKLPKNLEGGIGLDNMQERVEALNGNINIKLEKGFQIFITIKKEISMNIDL